MAAAGAVLLAQALVDWLWLIPGLTGLGLACLALAVAIVALPGDALARRAVGRGSRIALVAVALAAATLVGALYLSDLDVRVARSERAQSPAAQLASARSARRVNPLALAPRYLEAGALEGMGRRNDARTVLRDALGLEPHNFVTMGLLGDLETRAGDHRAAQSWYRRALALNPRDTGLRQLAAG